MSCDYCHDQGIVELAGIHPDATSRGSAPCRWCPQGQKLRKRLTEQKHHPLTDYSIHSLAATPQPGYHATTREEALADWTTCHHQWKPEGSLQARPWAGDAIQWKTCSRCAKQEVDTLPLQPHHHARRTT